MKRNQQPKPRTQKALQQKEREVLALELPLRSHFATMSGIALRNERLRALNAAMVRSDLQRIDELLHIMPVPRDAAVLNAARQLKAELADLAKA